MKHVTLTHESWPIHSYVPQDQLRALHKWDSHFAHMNEWYHTYEYVNTHSCTCATGPAADAAHMDESCLTQKSCHTYGPFITHSHEYVITHSHVNTDSFTCATGPAADAAHMDESWHTYESCHAYKWYIIHAHVPQDQLRALHKFSEPWLTKSKVAVCCKETHMCGKAIHICGKRDPDMWQSDVRMWQKKRTWQ